MKFNDRRWQTQRAGDTQISGILLPTEDQAMNRHAERPRATKRTISYIGFNATYHIVNTIRIALPGESAIRQQMADQNGVTFKIHDVVRRSAGVREILAHDFPIRSNASGHRFGHFRPHLRMSSDPVTPIKISVDVLKLAA
ncbi:hypothetical protein [Actinoplanes sp. NPDC026623]|uniref:hypothetical protein n=1 Tax=Actinoplanes sp. NPDC026623 TaxID=3155610 RepID=UPI0033D05562